MVTYLGTIADAQNGYIDFSEDLFFVYVEFYHDLNYCFFVAFFLVEIDVFRMFLFSNSIPFAVAMP